MDKACPADVQVNLNQMQTRYFLSTTTVASQRSFQSASNPTSSVISRRRKAAVTNYNLSTISLSLSFSSLNPNTRAFINHIVSFHLSMKSHFFSFLFLLAFPYFHCHYRSNTCVPLLKLWFAPHRPLISSRPHPHSLLSINSKIQTIYFL